MKKMLLSVMVILSFIIAGCSNKMDTPVSPESTVSLDKKPGEQSIVEIAASNPNFSSLVAAVQFAGLVDALNSNRQLTVFAPVNAAFDTLAWNLGYANVGELLVPANKDLVTRVLLYHVAPGLKYAKNVLAAGEVMTLAGQYAYVMTENGNAYIGNSNLYAKIIATDIRARNGVIHVLDNVILPSAR